jgi:adenosine deaminase
MMSTVNVAAYPKVELHLHLDCSLSYDVVHTLDPTVTLAEYRHAFIAPLKCTNLVDYLARAPRPVALMQTAENLRLVVLDLFQQLKRDHVIYAEIRFAPLLHIEQGLTPAQVVAAVDAATSEGIATTGVEARLILCTMRHYTEEQSMQTVRLVEQFRGTNVVALDIAGDEAGYPLTAHIPAFQYAREHNIARTAHAGEASGPQSVWETLKQLQPTRIGHGARSIEDATLLTALREQHIHLELCPTSNLQTNMYDDYPDHPIQQLYTAGISLNVNTDCRTITPTTLSLEYEHLQTTFDWQKADYLRCNQYALQAAFLPPQQKEVLEQRLLQAFADRPE